MEIAKMSAAQLKKAMDSASLESSKIVDLLIDAGRGNERPNDMMSKSDPLSLKYQKNSSLLQSLYAEKNRRQIYHGSLRPIKYQENPTMATKKFSPAQIAAQKLFAERARAGTLGKGKRKAAVKRRANPEPYNPYASRNMLEEYAGKTDDQLRYIIKDAFAAAKAQRGMQSEMKYLDQVNDANTVLYRRRKGLNEVTGSKIGKMKIERSETPDNPEGIVVTEAGALRFAKQNMPSDLKKAGFVASVFPGARGWVINYGKAVKRNPDKTKPRAYVKRASQATGAPPSKRLLTRRKKALSAPAGYFPNPKTKKAATLQDRVKKFKVELNFDKFKTFKKVVGYYPSDTSPDYELVALFQTQAQAVNAAESYAENYPKYRWFVKGL